MATISKNTSMNSDHRFYLTFVLLCVVFVIFVVSIHIFEKVEFAKAGLQQCVIEKSVSTLVVWQRECNN
jgi:hypothetical protein